MGPNKLSIMLWIMLLSLVKPGLRSRCLPFLLMLYLNFCSRLTRIFVLPLMVMKTKIKQTNLQPDRQKQILYKRNKQTAEKNQVPDR